MTWRDTNDVTGMNVDHLYANVADMDEVKAILAADINIMHPLHDLPELWQMEATGAEYGFCTLVKMNVAC